MVDLDAMSELDGGAAADAVERAHAVMLHVEAERFFLAAHWAVLHSGDAVEDVLAARRAAGGRVLPGMERGKRIGGDGTPLVGEFAAMEFGALAGMGFVAAQAFMRDALDVVHRHPVMAGLLAEGKVRVWEARKVARMCSAAGLDRDQARWVDAVTSPYLPTLTGSRFEQLVEAKIIEADPEAAEERARAARLARFVRTGQSSEYGIKTLIARAEAGEVIFFVAMVDRIAHILALGGDRDPVDVLRSKAIGILATPARAVAMLQAAAQDAEAQAAEAAAALADAAAGGGLPDPDEDVDDPLDGFDGLDDPGEDPEEVSESDVHPSQNDADDDPAEKAPCPTCCGTGAVSGNAVPFLKPSIPAQLNGLLGGVDPRRLLPNATLYIHLAQESLQTGVGVARVEGVGPVTINQARDFLKHCNVRVVPVLDLANQRPVDAYETPAKLAEALHLLSPACASPYGTNLSRKKDRDHVIPYIRPDEGGPPGQTGLENLAPLSRFAHRVKTFGRWRLRQHGLGVWEWRSPHGRRYLIDRTGTHDLGVDKHIAQPRPGTAESRRETKHVVVEMWRTPFPVEFDLDTFSHHR